MRIAAGIAGRSISRVWTRPARGTPVWAAGLCVARATASRAVGAAVRSTRVSDGASEVTASMVLPPALMFAASVVAASEVGELVVSPRVPAPSSLMAARALGLGSSVMPVVMRRSGAMSTVTGMLAARVRQFVAPSPVPALSSLGVAPAVVLAS